MTNIHCCVSGVLPCNIEEGRYITQQVEDGIYILCGNGAIEDEEHFIHHYAKYVHLRIEFYNTINNDVFQDKWILDKCLKADEKSIIV